MRFQLLFSIYSLLLPSPTIAKINLINRQIAVLEKFLWIEFLTSPEGRSNSSTITFRCPGGNVVTRDGCGSEMASLSMNQTRSFPISVASRVGAGLIMLAGGRSLESMRTHGLAKATVYANFHKFIDAINTCKD
jgi:hypothetical protein